MYVEKKNFASTFEFSAAQETDLKKVAAPKLGQLFKHLNLTELSKKGARGRNQGCQMVCFQTQKSQFG
jgi:hypothetical protein